VRAGVVAGLIGLAGLATAALLGRSRMEAVQANIRRYSMPGPASYDRVAHLIFRGRYRAIATAIAAELPAGSSLLDVGCGPGEILVELVSLAPNVETTGLDIDAPMIARAERKADDAVRRGARSRPTFVVADAASMPFADASFDVVVSSFAVHHWPDREAGLAEMMRVLRPGGRAIIWDIAPPHAAAEGDTAAGAPHGHASPSGHGSPHGGRSSEAPAPSVLRTLRMLMLFRRMPFERYDFAKPAG
jgi:ubiquinone/menaquinone biosynthesis C-methylase UbiE